MVLEGCFMVTEMVVIGSTNQPCEVPGCVGRMDQVVERKPPADPPEVIVPQLPYTIQLRCAACGHERPHVFNGN